MGRKSKQAGGNLPLTQYERTKKFAASSDYGTISQRLAGHAQYQLGDCALTTQRLNNTSSSTTTTTTSTSDDATNVAIALCSPSGYLYAESAIVEYLLQETIRLKQRQQTLQAALEQDQHAILEARQEQTQKRLADFRTSQSVVVKKSRSNQEAGSDAKSDLHRVSYWLSSAQPVAKPTTTTPAVTTNSSSASTSKTVTTTSMALVTVLPATVGTLDAGSTALQLPHDETAVTDSATTTSTLPRERPVSPMTGAPLRRKDLWPVTLTWTTMDKTPCLVCAVSHKTISSGAAVVAYWTSKSVSKQPGRLVLQATFDELSLGTTRTCPLTDARISHVRVLQKSGSSFAASGQAVTASHYRPTIT
jgi:hypothetical protein